MRVGSRCFEWLKEKNWHFLLFKMCNIPHDINISYVVHFAKKKSFLGFRWKNKNRMNLIHFGFFSENLLQLFWLHCEHMKIMYVNCGLRNEYESDPAPSWLVSLVDRTLHRYRKGEKEKKKGNIAYTSQYFHCESTCIPLMKIGTTTVFCDCLCFYHVQTWLNV